MLRDIDRQPVAAKVDPLAGFRKVPVGRSGNPQGSALRGFVLTVSKTSLRLSVSAAKFLAGIGVEYVEIMTNQAKKQVAIVPSSKQSVTARHLLSDSLDKATVLPQFFSVTKTVREAFGDFDNVNLAKFRYRFTGELVDDGAAGVLIFDVGKPSDATRVKGAK